MPKAGDLNMGNSAELWFFFDNEWRPWRNNHVFSFGIGLDWRNYRMEDNYCFRKDAEGMSPGETARGSLAQLLTRKSV